MIPGCAEHRDEEFGRRSASHHVDELHAPILLVHGRQDWRIHLEDVQAFDAALEAKGISIAVTFARKRSTVARISTLPLEADPLHRSEPFRPFPTGALPDRGWTGRQRGAHRESKSRSHDLIWRRPVSGAIRTCGPVSGQGGASGQGIVGVGAGKPLARGRHACHFRVPCTPAPR